MEATASFDIETRAGQSPLQTASNFRKGAQASVYHETTWPQTPAFSMPFVISPLVTARLRPSVGSNLRV